jgi:hypothetical protein
MNAIEMIKAERDRQIRKGWTPEHDDSHFDGSLRVVAAVCACDGTDAKVDDALERGSWGIVSKWGTSGSKPNRIRILVIAAALLVAEIERIQRKQ